jgi:hypothetical protein
MSEIAEQQEMLKELAPAQTCDLEEVKRSLNDLFSLAHRYRSVKCDRLLFKLDLSDKGLGMGDVLRSIRILM